VHQLPSHVKIVAALFFIFVSIATPISTWAAFIGYFIVILLTAKAAKIPLLTLGKRALIEIPFIFFAILMPFFGKGEVISIGPFELYKDGIEAALSIVAKGTIGVLTAVILSTSTTAREILRGLERLKLPRMMVQIATFMLRYVNVISDEMERMKIARESRGFEATGIKHWKVLATVAASLFIRSYERGERIHLAMLSRGYAGELPHEESRHVPFAQWATALSVPFIALLILLITTRMGQ
jgi:cobalt/nickel transport system permease protein